jgi:hypothetical protein
LAFFASANASCQFGRHWINSDMLMVSLPKYLKKSGFIRKLLTFCMFRGDGLTEADALLSATRFPGMTAAGLKM